MVYFLKFSDNIALVGIKLISGSGERVIDASQKIGQPVLSMSKRLAHNITISLGLDPGNDPSAILIFDVMFEYRCTCNFNTKIFVDLLSDQRCIHPLSDHLVYR